jgi:hypothetical protein
VRNETAARVDDIRPPVLADLDLRYDVPDELQVYFGNTDPGVARGTGEGERHIRFGPAIEIDRTVVDLVRNGFDELRLL